MGQNRLARSKGAKRALVAFRPTLAVILDPCGSTAHRGSVWP